MADGQEQFEKNWHNNQNALFAFSSVYLQAADFDRVWLGAYDVELGTFTPGDDVLTGHGLRLVVRVGEGGLRYNLTPPYDPTLIVTYDNGASHTTTFTAEGLKSEGYEYTPAVTFPGIDTVTNVTTPTPFKLKGILDFYAPVQEVEDFEDGWPPPDLGLL